MPFLRGNISFYDYEISDQVAHNVKNWLDYSLLQYGAFTNVQFSNPSNSGYTNLQQSNDFTFEGLGPEWVWETDVQTVDGSQNPILTSGIYINNIFYPPSSSGTYPYIINFREGQVIFSNPQSGINVGCEYCMKDIDVYLTDSPQWKRLVSNYLTQYNNFDTSYPSGLVSILKEDRVLLPAVIIETQDNNNTAFQLGGGEWANIKVLYHVFSDKPFANKRLSDLINNQRELTFQLYDINKAPFPYNRDGSVASGARTYLQLASQTGGYFWTTSFVAESQGGPRGDILDIYRSEIRQTHQILRYPSTY